MSNESRGQVSAGAAEIYENFFVPALFAEWAPRLVEAARVTPGTRALDVACGSGVVARELAKRAGAEHVFGLDCNAGMLAIARRSEPKVRWYSGRAEELPFEDASFDVVTCQFALMFFEDRVQALREMARVLRPSGRLCVAVWGTLDDTPGYRAMTDLLAESFGQRVASELEAPFCLGELQALRAVLEAAFGARAQIEIRSLVGVGRFPSLDDWLRTEVRGWTLAEHIDDAGVDRLLELAPKHLSRFEQPDGSVEFASPAHIVTLVSA